MASIRPLGGDTFRGLLFSALLLLLAAGCQSMPAIRGQSPEEFTPETATEPGRLQGVYAEPAPSNVIADIQIEGNVSIETGAILGQIRSQPGRPADEQQIKEDLRALHATRWFFSVERRFRMTDKGMVLVFRVVERPVVRNVIIEGNTAFSTREIRKNINIEPGSPFDVATNRSAASRIERLYREKKSFPDAKVTLESGGDPGDRDVIFVIDEGDRVVVHNTVFEGNESISSGVLRTRLKSKRTLGGWLLHYAPFATLFGGKHDEETLPEDIASLKQYYQGLGYFDVKIDRQIDRNTFEILPELRARNSDAEPYRIPYLTLQGWQSKEFTMPNVRYPSFRRAVGATYRYVINEGPRYRVRNVEVEGNHVFSTEMLASKFELNPGDMFNSRFLNKDVASMREKYGAQGRLFARVEAVPRFLEDQPGVVDVVYQIDEDKPYTIRRINVHIDAPGGNPHTKERVVQHRMLLDPGDLADPELIDKSKQRMKGQIFIPTGAEGPRIQVSRVENAGTPRLDSIVRGQNPYDSQPRPFNPLYEDGSQGDPFGGLQSPFSRALSSAEADLDVYVTEAQSGRLMFGVGVNSNAGVLGQFTLEENNFDITRLPTSWQDLMSGEAFRGNGERFRIEAMPGELLSRYMVSWQTSNFLDTDFSFGVSGFYYNRYLPGWDEERLGGRLSLGYQFDKWWSFSTALRLEDVEITNLPPIAIPLVTEARGHSTLSTVRMAVAHDTRDSSFLPSEGHFVEAAVEQAFGDFTYPRVELQGTQHYTITEREDGAGRHILTLHGEYNWSDTGTPLFERYFAGGYQSFRGFAFRGVSPVAQGLRIGGENMILASAEYSIPITADEMIRVVGFVDSGTVADSEDDVSASRVRLAAGFGLRLSIPQMGPAPLAFDFGFPVLSEDEDDERVFSFTLAVSR